MASNVPYSQENELLNSGSDEEDSDDISETATRTRSKKKARVPRPIEPNVQVQNDQENAGRSGEVSEDRDLGYGDIWSANKVIQTEREYKLIRLYMCDYTCSVYVLIRIFGCSKSLCCFLPKSLSLVFEVYSWLLLVFYKINMVFIYL